MARKLIKFYNLDTVPTDYLKLYNIFRVEKIYIDMKPNVCGYVQKLGKQVYDFSIDYLVAINENMMETRKRFTECHELGHVVLTHLYNAAYLYDDDLYEYGNYSSKIRKIELEANAFAAELLMPVDKIKHYYFSERIQNVNELAKIFEVSHQAMEYRIKNIVNL